jgi:hypothetical protein
MIVEENFKKNLMILESLILDVQNMLNEEIEYNKVVNLLDDIEYLESMIWSNRDDTILFDKYYKNMYKE